MRRRQDNEPYGQRVGPGIQTVPLGAVWSAFTSALGEQSVTVSPLGASGDTTFTTTPVLVTMTTTAQVTVPVSTLTVESTILETSYVTEHLTTGLVEPTPRIPASVSTSASSSHSSKASASSQVHLSLAPSNTQHKTLPAVITQSSQIQPLSTSIPQQVYGPTATPSATSGAGVAQAKSVPQKHAIAGGLGGAAAGFVLIGLLLCFCFRRRSRRREQLDDDSINEKGIRPAIARQWTALTGKGTPKPTPQIPQDSSPVTVDEDHHIIRMSLTHWARPFAQGQGEGFRDSVAPGQLRVVNPDPSRPTTPRMSSDTAGSFLRRQRSALAAVLLSANRSRASSRANIHQAGGLPEITIDPALSRECIAPAARTPSFRSYPSVTSLPFVQQQPPEDPFVTPPLETADSSAQQRPKRPSLAPLQSAAGAASRTLSHIGSFLNPFRTQSNVAESVRTFSRHSVSTMSSRLSRRDTGFSDPFDLDKPSVRGSAVPGRTEGDMERGEMSSRIVYEGT